MSSATAPQPPTNPVNQTPSFSFAQARRLVGDLTRPNPMIYWVDFLLSIISGHVAIHLIFFLPQWYPESVWMYLGLGVCYAATVVLYMRALMFIHELVHLPKKGFAGFRVAWNALCGIFFFVPSFLYYPHVDHHRRKHYGTEHDGEYLPLSHRSRWMLVGFIAQALVIPFLGIARFLLISPICWVFPKVRPWVHRHMSTMLVDPFYRRNDASPKLMRMVIIQEAFCFLWAAWFLVRGGIMRDQWFDPFWLVAYAVGVGVLVLNEVRTLGAHRWTNEEGEMTFEQQLLDSVNYPRPAWIAELWGPTGTRYHALHHLFPSIPYHNLGIAHRRLVEGLPEDSPYHRTVAMSLSSELAALWQRAGESSVRGDLVRKSNDPAAEQAEESTASAA